MRSGRNWGRLGMKYNEVCLADVCDLIAGYAFKSKDFGDFDDKVIKITHITPPIVDMNGLSGVDFSKYNREKLKRYIAKSGDYVLAMTGATIGKIGRIVSGEAYINQRVLLFKNKDAIDKDFLYYVLLQHDFEQYVYNHIDSESAQPNISATTIGKYIFSLPPMSIQQKIGRLLRSLDEKCEVNNAINHNLQQQAQTLFKKWFIGKNIGFKDVSLSTLMSYAGGSQPPASEFIATPRDGYVRFVQIRDYETDGHINYIPISSKNKLCEETDIMIARYGASLGRICFGLNGAYNVALAKVFPQKPYYREFLRCYLSSRDFYEGINNRGGRSAQAGFNESDIRSFILSFPCDDMLVREFENTASPMFAQRLSLLKENRKLVGIRDTLLPKLMSGEIDVSDIQL